LNRRQTLAHLAAGAATTILPGFASGAKAPGALGCLLAAGEIEAIEEREGGLTMGAITDRVVNTTGDAALDRALGMALVRLARTFGERPGFGFFDDRGRPNAYASRETKVPGTWGTVVYGQTLFADLMRRNSDKGMAVLAVAAHEFGHIAQYRRGVDGRLRGGAPTVKRIELHADFLSGYFLGLRKREDSRISVWAAGKTFYEIGDYDFNNEGHHGTPDERVAAAEAGFKHGSQGQTYDRTFSAGVDFILSRFS